jgi:hypothetical protein
LLENCPTMVRALLAFTLCLAACNVVSGKGSSSVTGEQTDCVKPDRGVNNGPLPEGCTKIEGGEIGTATTVTAGGTTITITGWITKDGEEGEYVGFTYTSSTGAHITIKAGTQVYEEDGDGTWIHPAGTSGPDASAISNIVFCEEDPGDGMDDGTDDGMDDGCDPVDTDGDGDPDETDPDDDGDGIPDDQEPGDNACTADEDCASGICLDGVCVAI